MLDPRESLLLTGISDPSDVIPLGRRLGPRRIEAGVGSFDGTTFRFRRAVRRMDEAVLVEVDPSVGAPELSRLGEAVTHNDVAQLVLGSVVCRARAVGWAPSARCLVFELHRQGSPDAPVSYQRVTAAHAALSWGAPDSGDGGDVVGVGSAASR